ncbi:MAG: metal-dependent hydrolase [Polyangiales bacterium]
MAPITVRNLRFPLDDTPQYWLGGQRSLSLLLDQLSIVFPPGESFFMESVRAFERELTDPTLRAAVRGFHAQEALHGREHAQYNERLAKWGYPVKAIDRSSRRMLALARLVLPKRAQLAVTAALEHFTALFAQVALAEDSFLHKAHPQMDALWRWHAAEENEHSAVAFDVLQQVSGSYPLRVSIMVLATTFFLLKTLEHQLRMMAADGILFSREEWRAFFRFLFVDPAMLVRVYKPYLEYYRRDFHPHQIDSSALLETWKREFASAPIYRDNLYAKRSALVSEPA